VNRGAKQKRAVIVADSAAVLCPHCSAEQPSPESGADTWLPAEIQKHEGPLVCVSCDEPFALHMVARVQFGAA